MDGGKNNSKRKRKGKRKGKEGKEGDGAPGGGENDGSVAKIPRHAAVRPPTTSKSSKSSRRKPTSILASFKQKLQGSKFRWLNEQLYTSTSQSSCSLIERNPEYFDQYHAGYREQTKSWPVRPVDRAIQWLRSKPEVRVVADLGCGDAEIARAMDAPSKGANKKTVHNFDLWQNSRGNVTVCNIADVPLPDGSVDACVFCLSLMGTDYGAFLVEAARILRGGGHLWIAEVTSRAVQRAEGFNIVPDLVAAIEALGFCCVSKRVGEGSYFFELVFAVDVGRRKKSVQFPELRACAYKKR